MSSTSGREDRTTCGRGEPEINTQYMNGICELEKFFNTRGNREMQIPLDMKPVDVVCIL